MDKYHRDGAFEDPVVRCTECHKMIFRDTISKIGMCPDCGNQRMRNVLVMSEDELQILKDKNVDPLFLALYEVVE